MCHPVDDAVTDALDVSELATCFKPVDDVSARPIVRDMHVVIA
jgi:hypothetical protein